MGNISLIPVKTKYFYSVLSILATNRFKSNFEICCYNKQLECSVMCFYCVNPHIAMYEITRLP